MIRAAWLALWLSAVSAAQTPNPRLTALGENTALDLGRYQCTPRNGEPASVCTGNTDYSGMTYDARRHQVLLFGGGHSATYRDDVDVFDFQSLTWSSAYPPTPCEDLRLDNLDPTHAIWRSTGYPVSRHTYDLLAMGGARGELFLLSLVQGRGTGCHSLPPVDPDAGSPYVIATGRFAAYDPDARTWRTTEVPSVSFQSAAELDPVSGLILLVGQEGISTYDPDTGQLTKHVAFHRGDFGASASLVYFPPNDRFYWMVDSGSVHGVFEVHFRRDQPTLSTITQVAVPAPPVFPLTGWAYDSVHQRIGGGVKDGLFFTFDPLQTRYEVRRIQPEAVDAGIAVGSIASYAIAFDPVDGVYVFRTNWSSGVRTWVYRWGGEEAVLPDAGMDGGSLDAGRADGGSSDAGSSGDAGAPDADAGLDGEDGGHGPPVAFGSCGCASMPWSALVGVLFWLAVAWRRKA